MNYYINNEEVTKLFFEGKLFEALNLTSEEMFDIMLDETHEEISLVGIKYDVSYLLREVDPIAYQQEYNSYLDSLMKDRMYEMEIYEEEFEILDKVFMIR